MSDLSDRGQKEAERLLNQGCFSEAGAAFEALKRPLRALQAYEHAADWARVAGIHAQGKRFAEAAGACLRGLPAETRPVAALSAEQLQLAQRAALHFVMAGEPLLAAGLYANLGSAGAAADLLRGDGRLGDAEQVLVTGAFAANPWPAGELGCKPGTRPNTEPAPAAAMVPTSPLFRMERLKLGIGLRTSAIKDPAPPEPPPTATHDEVSISTQAAPDPTPFKFRFLGQSRMDTDAGSNEVVSEDGPAFPDTEEFDVPPQLPTAGAPEGGEPRTPTLFRHSFFETDFEQKLGLTPPNGLFDGGIQDTNARPPIKPTEEVAVLSEQGDLPKLPLFVHPPSRSRLDDQREPSSAMPEQEDPSPTAPPHAPSGATPDRALWSGDVPTVEPAPIRAHFGLDPDVAADERSDSLWTTAFSGPPKSSVLQPGELICERYEVVRILGTGGMGSVYEVRDKELRESVALKLFHHIGEDPVALDRFRQEMVICRRLSHAAIVRTFEFGRWDGHYFYTMELLVGQDLNAVIESRYDPMRAADGVPLLQQICDGLSAAHEQGVIHRDIKPHNVFLLKGGRTVKVMDFGVAKSAELGMVPTAAGILLGTPAYMSPERLMSGESDGPAVDLWALGVLAYTLFTGTQPFPGDNLAEVVPRIISGNLLAPRLLCPSINARLEAVILRMLLKDPKKRYQSADAVRVALERVRS